MDKTVLVVDDRATLRRALAGELAEAGFRVIEARDGEDAWARFRLDPPDLVITDVVMPRSDGLELVGRIRARSPIPVIVFSAQAGVEAAVNALKRGADEFVAAAELEVEALVALAARLAGRARPDAARRVAECLVGESPAARRVRDRLLGLAPLREPVLVTGERGTGRDTAVRLLHELGGPRAGLLHAVRPGDTDEHRQPPARGTLYLDEIDRHSGEAQRRWRRLLAGTGAPGAHEALRVVASARPELRRRVEEGGFDRGLAERLLRFEVLLPPLRERPEDIPRIARALVGRIGRELGRPGVSLESRALERLRREVWPGNTAELAAILEKAVGFATTPRIRSVDVEEILAEFRLSVAGIRERAAAEQRRRLVEVLQETGGNVTRAAEILGRSRAAVYRLAQKHGLPLRREF